MTSDEVWDLLELVASIDRRKLGLTDRQTWEMLIGDLPAADAKAAVLAHYRDSREWVMPADIRRRVKEARRERIADAEIPAPPPELLGDTAAWCAAVRAAATAVADGRDPVAAMDAIAANAARPELEA